MLEYLLVASIASGGAAQASESASLLAMASSMTNKTGEPMVCEMLCFYEKYNDWFCEKRAFCGTQEQLSAEKEKMKFSLEAQKQEEIKQRQAASVQVEPSVFLGQIILVLAMFFGWSLISNSVRSQ